MDSFGHQLATGLSCTRVSTRRILCRLPLASGVDRIEDSVDLRETMDGLRSDWELCRPRTLTEDLLASNEPE
jgi:hypothetical protein